MPSEEATALLRSFTDARLRTKQLKETNHLGIVDGSKIIFRLRKNDKIHYDNAPKIILATPKITVEHHLPWHNQITATEEQNLVVLDSSSPGLRFYPIALKQYGTIYTRPGTVHICVGESRRMKVSCRSLPYKTCNKFENASGEQPSTSPNTENENTSNDEGFDNFLYIRSDESMIRYRLSKNDRMELHSGRIVAWTLGVHFEFKNICCVRFVSAVTGEGTVWIHNWRNNNVGETEY